MRPEPRSSEPVPVRVQYKKHRHGLPWRSLGTPRRTRHVRPPEYLCGVAHQRSSGQRASRSAAFSETRQPHRPHTAPARWCGQVAQAATRARRSSSRPGFSKALYRNRNAVERAFGRLKDFRRVATRYDRRADVFLSAVALAATVSYWL